MEMATGTHTQNPAFRLKRVEPFWPIVNGMHEVYQQAILPSALPDSLSDIVHLTVIPLSVREDMASNMVPYGGNAEFVQVPEDVRQPANVIMQQLCGEILASVTRTLIPGLVIVWIVLLTWFDVHVTYSSNACRYTLYNSDM